MKSQCSNKERTAYITLIILLITIPYLATVLTRNDTYTIITNSTQLDCKCSTEPTIEHARHQENQGLNYTIKIISIKTQKCTCEARN
jgi:hypothetical protein